MNSEPTYGVPPYDTLRSMSGIAFLKAICEGRLPQAPIAKALGFRMVEAEEGMTAFIGVPSHDFYNPIGTVHGGWYGTLLDSCMGCAVQTTLEQGTGYTTVDYSVNMVRPIFVDTGPVRAEGHLIHRGRRIATVDGKLFDSAGKLLGHGTSTCMIMELPAPKG